MARSSSSTRSAASLLLALVASAALLVAAQAAGEGVPRPVAAGRGVKPYKNGAAYAKPGGYEPKPGGYQPKPGGYKPKPGGYEPKPGYVHKPCVGATIDPYGGEVTPTTCGTKKDKCCEGWLCKTEKPLVVGYEVSKTPA